MCKSGSPLPSIFCGRGPNHQDCPSGYYCNIDPLDRFAVCCAQVIDSGHTFSRASLLSFTYYSNDSIFK
ncbi:hypothetical protein ACJMK2_042490 [Sinanodonta woodiana]|uniref:Uncharacterized protein n=1 Tax=Sinanodonta woodiana TaxID=1069815 RepID=A0ABD3WAU0_SINWO